MAPNLRAQMLMRDQIDGAFAFRTGISMDIKLLGANPETDLRFISYEDYGMNLYSNTVIVSKDLVTKNPDAVRGFIKALNRGIKDALADRDAAVASVLKREPLLNAKVERERLDLTFDFDMSAPEMKNIGLGDVMDSRVEQNIKIMVDANSLPQTPTVGTVFDRRFLPPASERIKHF
jgi:NitT/TauT family transport system substrate-binding protein